MDAANTSTHAPGRLRRPSHDSLSRLGPARAIDWTVFTCLAVFASRVVWYDLRIVVASLRMDMRWLFVVYAVCLIPFILLAAKRVRFGHLNTVAFGWFFFIFAYGWVVYLAWGRGELGFALQDTFKLCFVPALFVLVATSPLRRIATLLNALAWLVIAYQLMRFSAFAWLTSGYFYFGGVTDCYPSCYFLARLLKDGERGAFRNLACLGLALALVVVGQKRTLLVALAIVWLYACWRARGNLINKPMLQAAVFVSLLIVVGCGYLFGEGVKKKMFERLGRTDLAMVAAVETPRQVEVREVYDQLAESGNSALMLGLGHGATFYAAAPDPVTGNDVVHSVHFTPAAMHLRYGLAGWLFYLSLIWALLRAREPRTQEYASPTEFLALKNYVLAAFVSSIAMFGFVDDMLVGLAAGVFYVAQGRAYGRARRTRAETRGRVIAPPSRAA